MVPFLALAALTSAAHADSTFMLQLGSYNSEAEATQQWDQVKAKSPDVVGNLNLHVAEVALPPDNTISYRTQAGPVASRAQASALCDKLQSQNTECYVVETALFTGDSGTPAASAAAVAPVAATASAPPASTATSSMPSAPTMQMDAAMTTPATIPVPPAQPAEASIATNPYVPPPSAASPSAQAPASPSVFNYSADTPFPATAGSANSAPVSAVSSTSVTAPPAAMTQNAGEAPQVAPPAPTSLQPTPSSQPVTSTASQGNVVPGRGPRFLNEEVGGSSASQQVPAPLYASDNQPGAYIPAPPSVQTSETTGANPAPAEESHNKPGFFSRIFGSSSSERNDSAPPSHAVGNVDVAEAIRVPLGSGKPAHVRTIPNLPAVHGLGGTPSQSTAKTYWAQLSYFTTENAARNFYDQFQTAYPQFSDGVRVRITRPYSQAVSVGRVSLLVGPFAGTTDIRTICRAATRNGLRCTVVRDLGSSPAENTPGRAANYSSRKLYYGDSRYQSGQRVMTENFSRSQASPLQPGMELANATQRASSPFSSSTYWAQLGSYNSPQEAWDKWRSLQSGHRNALKHAHAIVASPMMSSSLQPLYRLRVGPFAGDYNASAVCASLSGSGNSCIVVSER